MLIKLEKVWVSPNYQNGKLLLITKCKFALIKVYNSFIFFFNLICFRPWWRSTNNSLWCPYGKRETWQKSWRIDWVYGYQLFCHLGNKTEALDDILSSLCFVEGDEKKNNRHKSANHNGVNSFLKLHYYSWNPKLSQDFSSIFKQTRAHCSKVKSYLW